MQNHNTVNTTGFVSLEQKSGWRCDQCGCQNGWCSRCRQCGCAWPYSSGCVRGNGAQGNCTAEANVTCPHRDRGCNGNENRCGACADTSRTAADCRACPNEAQPQYVQPCPDNTALRDRTCDTCTANRNCTANACDTCPYRQHCSCYTGASCQVKTDCACQQNQGTASAATNAEKARNRAAGMVYAAKQTLDQVYDSESALRTGTLFPELHKPMNGYCPGDCNCSNAAQQAAFAAWELRLYLDTHPDDEQAWALFRQLSQETQEPNYATAFLPDDDLPNGWDWTQDPWPWSCRRCGE